MSAWPVDRGGARRGRRAAQPQGAAAAAGPRRPLGRHEVRPRRRAQRARARLGAGDRGARGRRRDREGAAGAARDRASSGACSRVGDVEAAPDAGDEEAFARARSSEIGCSDPAAEKRMLAAIDKAAADRDTLGGIIEIRAFGCPPGLGSHTEPRLRLDARLAAAAVGIQAMKGVEIGDAFANARLPRLGRARRAAVRRRRAATGARRTAPAASRAACRTASPWSCASR